MPHKPDRGAANTRAKVRGTGRESTAITPLIRQLSDRSWEPRMDAAAKIGRLLEGKGRTPRALIRRLKDSNELVRVEVAEALGAIGDRRAVGALWRALHDRSPLVRSYVVPAIGELGTRKDVARIERALQDERSAIAKVGYYAALHHLGRHHVVSELIKLLQSRNYRVRCAAANTLGGLASHSHAGTIARALNTALKLEPTVAARSSLRSGLRAVRLRLKAGVDSPKRQPPDGPRPENSPSP
jgi:HEAT repeat protein